MIQLTEKYWALQIPSMAFGIMINNYGDESELMYMLDIEEIDETNKTDETLIVKKLPPGNWSFICTSKECTEEQAKLIVETIHVEESPSPYNDMAGGWRYEYKDYVNVGEYAGWQGDAGCFRKALDSFRSLLTSKNITGNCAIIKKENP